MNIARSLLILATLFTLNPARAGIECHLHLPGSEPGKEIESLIIRAVGKPRDCEILNLRDFAGKARCHCSFSGIRQDRFVLPGRQTSPGADLL